MYADAEQGAKIYSSFIQNQPEEVQISSLAEQSPLSRSQIQTQWNSLVASVIEKVAGDNPYLPTILPGQEIPAVEAANFVQGSRGGIDCRPQIFDGVTKTWKLCDTGSMLTVVKKSSEDVVDKSRVLQAVNGSTIKVYGQKEIEIRIGRKTYPILATIADVQQDIIGWDFIARHKLDLLWSDSGLDYFIYDKKAKIKRALKFIALPSGEVPQTSVLLELSKKGASPEVSAFEVASMKQLGEEVSVAKIPAKYRKLIDQFPGILEPSFKDLSTKHGVMHKINTGSAPPSKAKVRPLLANSEKAIKGKEAWDQMVKLGVVERIDPKANSDGGPACTWSRSQTDP